MVYDDMGCDDVDDDDDIDDVRSLIGHHLEQLQGHLHLKFIVKETVTCLYHYKKIIVLKLC